MTMSNLCVDTLNTQEGRVPSGVRVNQYYPTDVKDLFRELTVDSITKEKWDRFLGQFSLGDLNSFVWLRLRSIVDSGWMYLLAREVAYRKETLVDMVEGCTEGCYTNYPPFSWLVWSGKWVYGGIEQEGDYKVISVPLTRIPDKN